MVTPASLAGSVDRVANTQKQPESAVAQQAVPVCRPPTRLLPVHTIYHRILPVCHLCLWGETGWRCRWGP